MLIGAIIGCVGLLAVGIVAFFLMLPRGIVETPNAPQNVNGQTYRVHFVDGVYQAKPYLVTMPNDRTVWTIHYALSAKANSTYLIETPNELSLHFTIVGPGIQAVKGRNKLSFVAPLQAEYRISVYSTQHIWENERQRTRFSISETNKAL